MGTVDSFDPLNDEMFQIIGSDGTLSGKDPSIPNELLKEMYARMNYARLADAKMLSLQRQGRMGTFAPSTGQEAAHTGPSMAMEKEDWMVPAFRELGAYLVRGIPLSSVILYYMGDPRGNIVPEDVRNMPLCVPVGTQLPHAAGIAYAMQLKGDPHSVLCFFGDGATSTGDFHEGLNFAGVTGAPVVFVSQNNQYAISVPRSQQTASRTLSQKAIAYGIRGIQVDGNDILAMYTATKEALELARSGKGPTLIEAVTYRLWMHTTADDPTRYRSQEELDQWKARDPITRMRSYLETKGLWNKEWEKELVDSQKKDIRTQVKIAESASPLSPDDMFMSLYASLTDTHTQQLSQLKDTLLTREIDEDAETIEGGFP